MKRKLLNILLLICAVLILVACGQTANVTEETVEEVAEAVTEETTDEAEDTTEEAAVEEGYACPVRGGVIKMNYPLPADRFGVPKNTIHYNQFYAGPAIEGLLIGGTLPGTYEPRLATEWVVAEDKLILIFIYVKASPSTTAAHSTLKSSNGTWI